MIQNIALNDLKKASLELLQKLISTPSFSKEEETTALIIEDFLKSFKVKTHRLKNNIWAFNAHYDAAKPTVLLNSHHDTVRPNPGYTRNPFEPIIENEKLYGLGSNDAGGCLVSLIATFLFFYDRTDLSYNLCLAATAEEEISGHDGLELVIPELGPLDFGIVGEPTLMDLAIAEKGLLVMDCVAKGVAGHAARDEGDNAIYKALKDIEWIKSYQFPKISEQFGAVKMTVTVIEAGSQHNVVPATCSFTVDVRVTDAYTIEEVISVIRANIDAEVTPRSVRLKPSFIDPNHPIVLAGVAAGRKTYGSPTTSDQALLDIPSVKVGPGFSGRSHSADEFIFVEEINQGIDGYIELLNPVIVCK